MRKVTIIHVYLWLLELLRKTVSLLTGRNVVGVTPSVGSGVAAQKIPANIQTVTSKHVGRHPKPFISAIHNRLGSQCYGR